MMPEKLVLTDYGDYGLSSERYGLWGRNIFTAPICIACGDPLVVGVAAFRGLSLPNCWAHAECVQIVEVIGD